MMAQGALPYQYEEAPKATGLTALGGLPVYLDLLYMLGFGASVSRWLTVRKDSQGWRDLEVVISLVLLNLAGGDCVDDLKILEGDEGFCKVLDMAKLAGAGRRERRALKRRWRKEKRRTLPSPSSVFRYLEAFHDPSQEALREVGRAFIPRPNAHLLGLGMVNRDVVAGIQRRSPQGVATLDMDATMSNTRKESAFYGYKGELCYQPLNIFWAEQEVVLHTEFRDGNVPAGYGQTRVIEEALSALPEGVETVRVRTDTQGYEHSFLRYMELGKNERFGRVEFAVGSDVTAEFKKAVAQVPEPAWTPLMREVGGRKITTGQEWAEVCFAPNAMGYTKKGNYRYLAIRERLHQPQLPGMETQQVLPFPTMAMAGCGYKLFGLVTNMGWEGGELIWWHRQRCGKSEEAHSIMKTDLAGGQFPSGLFGVNAAWWWIMILAFNVNAAMRRLVLGGSWATKRMKAIRYALVHIPGQVIHKARQWWIRLAKGHPSLELLVGARRQILGWMTPSPG